MQSVIAFKTLRRCFGSRLTPIQSAKGFESRLKRLILYVSFGSVGVMTYHNFVNTDLELIFSPTDFNVEVVNTVRDIKRMKYKSSPILFHRALELFYGNSFDDRDYVEYNREEVTLADGEKIALGWITRLGKPPCKARQQIKRTPSRCHNFAGGGRLVRVALRKVE